ncbi:borealin-related [Xylocopa sonorina]|uniref:borealin-related n=1 Tax=Xylocopa sonorina TaxID=1818115 RepID=UPI00403AFA2B
MPRTKHVRKPKQGQQFAEESDLLIRDFERQAYVRISKMEAQAKMAIKSFETFINVTLSRLPTEIQQMTLGEILKASDEKENCNEVSSSVDDYLLAPPATIVKEKKAGKRITNASDDGYVTEGVVTTRASRTTRVESSNVRRTRSSSRNATTKLSEINQGTVKKVTRKERNKESIKNDKFKTPATLKPGRNEYGLVTPKIKPNTPLNVLRRPRQGEMVLSMQGSPLLVSAVIQENTANINVPLRNGNVISLLPNDGLRMSHIPELDPETMRQLETLKNHIDKVISTK